MSLFNDVFVAKVVQEFRVLGGRDQTAGMKAIITGFEAYDSIHDPRWLAYMLATAFHETASTMQPVREAFWRTEDWRRKNLGYFPYYGRGYVQLTHQANYKKAGKDIGVDLVADPDLALRPNYAAHVMYKGMTEGWFRKDRQGPHMLQRYFGPDVDDPVGARNIINGREVKTVGGKKVTVAEIIADYHAVFLEALKDGQKHVQVRPGR
ncbi:MAG TPA: glycoside hydrolase family 19 protein [Ensifer sp.]|nr:glycoside hydrolase family 19 protein [Ensifer sp.]